jgi:hypothetical protein
MHYKTSQHQRNYRKLYYIKHRQEQIDYALAYQKKRRKYDSEYVKYQSEWAKNNYKKHPEKELYRNAKIRARRKGIEFNINIGDVYIPEYCPYLNIKLTMGTYKDRKTGYSPTIDRIDSTLGYIPSNIEVISDLANRMKQNATPQQLLNFAKSILNRFDNKRENN